MFGPCGDEGPRRGKKGLPLAASWKSMDIDTLYSLFLLRDVLRKKIHVDAGLSSHRRR